MASSGTKFYFFENFKTQLKFRNIFQDFQYTYFILKEKNALIQENKIKYLLRTVRAKITPKIGKCRLNIRGAEPSWVDATNSFLSLSLSAVGLPLCNGEQ